MEIITKQTESKPLTVTVEYPILDSEAREIIGKIRTLGVTIPACRDGQTYPLSVADIYYIEVVERRTFLYTKDAVYTADRKLYEFWYFTPGQAQYSMLQKSLFDALTFIPSSIALCFVVTIVYIKTGRSILAGAMVHMLSNLMGSQLLSPYDTEVGTVIRLVNIFFCTAAAIYAARSSRFQREFAGVTAEIGHISIR